MVGVWEALSCAEETIGSMAIERMLGLSPLNSRVSLGSQSRLPISRGLRRTLFGVPSGFLNSGTRTLTSKERVTDSLGLVETFSSMRRRASAHTVVMEA